MSRWRLSQSSLRTLSVLLALTAAPMAPVFGQGAASTDGPPVGPFTLPWFQFLRQNEDWSVLRGAPDDVSQRPLNRIKYVPLTDDETIWVSFGGHTRGRVEAWDNFAFGAPTTDSDEFALWRLTMHADLHVGPNARVFVEGISALSTDRSLPGGRRALDVNELDLQQGFADISFDLGDHSRLTIRAGRQAYLFGKQRLVSPLPWANSLRSWDGFTGILAIHDWTVTGFWSQFDPVQKFSFDDPDAGTEFFGAYATGPVPGAGGLGADLYMFGLHRDVAAFNGTAGSENRYTIGGRLFGRLLDGALDYDLEGAYQLGDVGAGDISAFMVSTQVGYTFSGVATSPRVHLGLDYASGDDAPGGDVQTFNQLFPLGHAYFGYIDFVGRQNVIDINPGVTLKPFKGAVLRLDGHVLWRADTSDALYNAGGGVVRAAGGSSSSETGFELDITLKYALSRHATALVGYSRFFAGDFIEDTGASSDIGFLYAQLQFTF